MKKRKILVTAGATITPIDKVRGVTNIFTGKTGTAIATYLASQSIDVTLLASTPSLVSERDRENLPNLKIVQYKFFWQLHRLVWEYVKNESIPFTTIIHSAAVSDYEPAKLYYLDQDKKLVEVDASGKVKSSHKNLFVELKPTPKIVDQIREWGFKGQLVKFKLEVGIPDDELILIAMKSREQSQADLIVANCLEWSAHYAYVIDSAGNAIKVSRRNLPEELYRRLA